MPRMFPDTAGWKPALQTLRKTCAQLFCKPRGNSSGEAQGRFKNCRSRREEALISRLLRSEPPHAGCYDLRRFLNPSWAKRSVWSAPGLAALMSEVERCESGSRLHSLQTLRAVLQFQSQPRRSAPRCFQIRLCREDFGVRRLVAAFPPSDSSPGAAGQVPPPESADKSAHSKSLWMRLCRIVSFAFLQLPCPPKNSHKRRNYRQSIP
jgi:hypothetical protein